MQDVSEMPRHWQAGQSARRIAPEMRIDRKPVGRYVDETKARRTVAETKVSTEDVARTAGVCGRGASAAGSLQRQALLSTGASRSVRTLGARLRSRSAGACARAAGARGGAA